MKLADAIAELLVAAGCRHAFGIVGGANLAIFAALARRVEVVACHHEQAAAMAGAYYWRTCGRLAPVLVTAGGGTMNAMTGVMAAWHDSVPLLVISGNEKSSAFAAPHRRAAGFQGFDPCPIVRPFVKGAWQPQDRAQALAALGEAIPLACTPRRGPVWLDICQDIANEMGE